MTADPQLNNAILAGDLEQVGRLLSGGADANAVTEGRGSVSLGPGSGLMTSGWTALMLAAYTGRREIVELLLRHGARVNGRDHYRRTPLMAAAMAGRAEVAALLLAHGAELEAVACETETALYWAAAWGHTETVQLLLRAGARANGTATGETTGPPLGQAVQSGHREAVRLLVEAGAPLETRDSRGWTPLMHASFAGQFGVAEQLLALGAQSALPDATARGDLARMSAHLAEGAPADQPDPRGHTPLYHAARWGQLEAARLLLDHGAAVDANDAEALQTAVAYEHPALVELLLQRGASLAARGEMLLLTAASGEGSSEIVRLLLDRGVDPNAGQTGRITPLHCAVETGDAEAVSLLLQRGANPNLPDERGITPLQLALDVDDEDLVRLLRDAGAAG